MRIANRGLALGAGICALVLTSCSSGNKQETQTTSGQDTTVRRVEVASIATDTIEVSESYTATIEPKASNNISAQTGGRLTYLGVQVGDRVSRGQVLARLDDSQLNQAQIQLSDAKTNFSRASELYEIGGISKAQWEQAQSAMRIAEQAYHNLQRNTILTSPISGVVTAKNYDVGDITSPQQPVVVVEQIVPVKAMINVSEAYYRTLRKGMKASLEISALGDTPIEGYVSNVYPTIDTRTHTIAIEVEVANADQLIRPGMYARIGLDLGKREALLMPDAALQRMPGSGQRYVYVYKAGVAEYRPVEVGALYGSRYEVLSGLEPGEQVITSSPSSLTSGARVSIAH